MAYPPVAEPRRLGHVTVLAGRQAQENEHVTQLLVNTHAAQHGSNPMYLLLLLVSAEESSALCHSAVMLLAQRSDRSAHTTLQGTLSASSPCATRLTTLAFRSCDACWDSTSRLRTVTGWVATANKAAPGEVESNEGSLLAQAETEPRRRVTCRQCRRCFVWRGRPEPSGPG